MKNSKEDFEELFLFKLEFQEIQEAKNELIRELALSRNEQAQLLFCPMQGQR